MACWDNDIDRIVPSDFLDVLFSNRKDGQNVLNVIFSFNCYEVYIVTEDSVLSIGGITYHIWNTGYSKPVGKLYKKYWFNGIPVHSSAIYYMGNLKIQLGLMDSGCYLDDFCYESLERASDDVVVFVLDNEFAKSHLVNEDVFRRCCLHQGVGRSRLKHCNNVTGYQRVLVSGWC